MSSCIEAMETVLQAAGMDWAGRYHHIRCLARIIHSAATALFFPSNDAPEDQDNNAWRQFACSGKIRIKAHLALQGLCDRQLGSSLRVLPAKEQSRPSTTLAVTVKIECIIRDSILASRA